MPLYRCAGTEGSTDEAQRARIAKEIVRIHCDATGAPPSFVHAFFSEAKPDELLPGKSAFVLGSMSLWLAPSARGSRPQKTSAYAGWRPALRRRWRSIPNSSTWHGA